MRIFSSATGRTLVLAVASSVGSSLTPTLMGAGVATGASDFPYVIEVEAGASEFATGDGIIIGSLRGNRKHLELGGRYVLDGSYTLASAEAAELAWFSTTRGPSGSTRVTEDQQVKISRGSGTFHLGKTLLDDGWLHVSFYVDKHSHGGVYFGEKGSDKTVLRRKGWSDFSSASPSERPVVQPAAPESGGVMASAPANAAIMAYLGNPVGAPPNLDAKYTPTNLMAAFTVMSAKAGWHVQRLAVDGSEFPFLVYGILDGRHELPESVIREIKGYDYCGSVRGSTPDGSTYFSLNMIPRDQYPRDQMAACNRRLMVRLQMLAEAVGKSE